MASSTAPTCTPATLRFPERLSRPARVLDRDLNDIVWSCNYHYLTNAVGQVV